MFVIRIRQSMNCLARLISATLSDKVYAWKEIRIFKSFEYYILPFSKREGILMYRKRDLRQSRKLRDIGLNFEK